MKKYKYAIVANVWNENDGGVICLHTLCHHLNMIGETAMLYPEYSFASWSTPALFTSTSLLKTILKRVMNFRKMWKIYKHAPTNPRYNTPKFNPLKYFFANFEKGWVFIYPENIANNPTHSGHVIRYFTHNPGHFSGYISYGKNELYFRYSNGFGQNYIPDTTSKISKVILTLPMTPPYYMEDSIEDKNEVRKGSAYLVRKGAHKPIIHDTAHSIQIDGKSHKEIAEIFRHVEKFISYDSATDYSRFALLCGCKSYIVLGEDETPETYRPNPEDRKYLMFDLNDDSVDIIEAQKIFRQKVKAEKDNNDALCKAFVDECEHFFID